MATVTVHLPADFTITRNDGSNGGRGSSTWNSGLIQAGRDYDAFDGEQIDLRFVFNSSAEQTISFDDEDGLLKDATQSVSGDSIPTDRLNSAITIGGTTYTPTDIGTTMGQGAVYVESEYALKLQDVAGNLFKVAVISISTGYQINIVGFVFEGSIPADGTILYFLTNTGSYLNGNDATISLAPARPVTCFAGGTQILTDRGLLAVDDLAVGDMVVTLDGGAMPVRWVGSRHLSALDLAAQPKLRPIRIRAGAFGPGVPAADLLVSPQHRVLVNSVVAQRMFNAAQILIAAKELVGLPGVEVAVDLQDVSYWHFMFDSHQVVFSNKLPTESLFTGKEALKSLGASARMEILALFPELSEEQLTTRAPARQIVKGAQGRKFVERILRNGKRLAA
ncbi:hemolysin-type calcium-binding region [Ketogulonicigenium robustum]|uniref:Hemolysin-type calcium-binding region n=1 Tax=Ketogulonicigenium robustum TaxID=92947 RepID=A0A1W6P2M4_9RHOB|nr:Hint domain-containing protein [Ketogulonicigenium robustum]ARO15768.1 hemolysin-type calcium-binding region [Ketogulonicigenium robustum]